MNVGFERINPVPGYPAGTSAGALAGLTWSSQKNVAKAFKEHIKKSLRTAQQARCCFCRRALYDDYATHLEHFIDKDGYTAYNYEILNLAVSCGTCNIMKNGHFKTWKSRFDRLFSTPGLPAVARCPVLNVHLAIGAPYPTNAADFRWVNPYVHNYSDHIRIARGWVFQGTSPIGIRTIRGARLNSIEAVEARALAERLTRRGGWLSLLVGAMSELETHRATEVSAAVVKVIKRRREAGKI
jgi:hypothetical protein